MSYIDLRDIIANKDVEPETYETWKEALWSDAGYDIEALADNEPTMIPDSEFIDYAQELAEDIGAIGRSLQWPTDCIDWDKAASELQMNYSSVEVDGTTYWFRSY